MDSEPGFFVTNLETRKGEVRLMYRDVDTICRGDDVKREIFQEHLNPDRLAENLSLALSKKTGSTSGHIHIHFCGRSDHFVIVWSNGRLKQIVAKSPRCKKGRYLRWEYSQFCDYENSGYCTLLGLKYL